jgi:hypothetical protein
MWLCKSCGSELCYDTKSKRLSVLVMFAWYLFPALLFMRFHLIPWWGFIPLVFVGAFPSISMLRVVLAQSNKIVTPDLHENAKDT